MSKKGLDVKNLVMKKLKRTIILLIIGLSIAMGLQSCAMMADPDFQEGFRQGWNSTAPPSMRY